MTAFYNAVVTIAGLVHLFDDDYDPAADHADVLAVATLQRRLCGIARVHEEAGHPNPTTAALVRDTMQGIRRRIRRRGEESPASSCAGYAR